MLSSILLILILGLIGLPTSAQETTTQDSLENPAEKIHAQISELNVNTKKLVLSSFVEIPTHSFLISTGAGRTDQHGVEQRIQYNPTFGPNVGVSGSFGDWSLSLSKKISLINEQDIQTYGKSDYDDWRVRYSITKNLLIESYYQNYRGFYTDLSGQEGLQTSFGTNGTPSSSNSQPGQSQIISRPDISALNYGLRTTYAIPMMPIFQIFASQEEKKSMNWDFNLLTKVYYNRMSITGDRPLVPAATSNSFSPIAALKEYWSNTLGVGAGLGIIVPASTRFIFGFDAMLGSGFQRQTNIFMDHENTAYTTAQEMNANLYLDWKGNNHGFRFGIYMDTLSSKVNDINFDTTNMGLNIIYSYGGIYL